MYYFVATFFVVCLILLAFNLFQATGLYVTNMKTKVCVFQKKNKLRGLSPRANYTDRAAASGRRS